MRRKTISWREDNDGEVTVSKNFLMACRFDGFDRDVVGEELKNHLDAEAKGDYYWKIMRIVHVFEDEKTSFRLVIWNDGEAELVKPDESCWVYMDVGRWLVRDRQSHYYIFEDEEATAEQIKNAQAILANYRTRDKYSEEFNALDGNRVFVILYDTSEKMFEKSAEEIEAEEDLKTARTNGDDEDMHAIEEEETEDLQAYADCKNAPKDDGHNWGMETSLARRGIRRDYGRGHEDVGGDRVRYKFGRMLNKKNGEYLVAPGLNFGPASWWQNSRRNYYNYNHKHTAAMMKCPKKIIKRLAIVWRDNVEGAYDDKDIISNYTGWLETAPELRMGIRDKKGVLVEKKLKLERRTHNPKDGKPYTHIHYCMNGFRVPKARWHIALEHWTNPDIPDWEFMGFLKQMGKYTLEMLEKPNSLQSISFKVPSLSDGKGMDERFDVRFNHRLNEGYWNIYCKDLMSGKVKVSHEDMRKFLGKMRSQYKRMAEIVCAFEVFGVKEDDFMQALEVRSYRRRMREQVSEDLLKDVAKQFPDRIKYDDKKKVVIIEGKIRKYIIDIGADDGHYGKVSVNKLNDDGSKGAWVCVIEDSRTDSGVAFDKVVGRALLLMNDEEAKDIVKTLR